MRMAVKMAVVTVVDLGVQRARNWACQMERKRLRLAKSRGARSTQQQQHERVKVQMSRCVRRVNELLMWWERDVNTRKRCDGEV